MPQSLLHVRQLNADRRVPIKTQAIQNLKFLEFVHLSVFLTMDDALAKIRPHTTSNLINQKTPANLLVALESTFEEQNTEATPTAYLAALLTTLEETLQRKETSLKEGDILPAELYLLALVAPFVPAPVIRSNLSTILSLTTPLFPALNQHAPPLKSQLSLYQALLLALDKSQLDVQGIRQAFASILMLCIDGRPKVRKRASEVVKDVLASPPSPLTRHPYANRVAEWIQSALKDVGQSPLARKGSQTNGTDTGIHILSFLRIILPHLPSSVSLFYFIFGRALILAGITRYYKLDSRATSPRQSFPFPVRILHALCPTFSRRRRRRRRYHASNRS